jgi:excisionase family DNA binding protein
MSMLPEIRSMTISPSEVTVATGVTVIVQPVLTFFKTLGAPVPKPKKIASGLLSSKEAAEYLGISNVTLRRMCLRKALSFVKVTSKRYRFDVFDLDEFKRSRTNRSRIPGRR